MSLVSVMICLLSTNKKLKIKTRQKWHQCERSGAKTTADEREKKWFPLRFAKNQPENPQTIRDIFCGMMRQK